jgi:hypothetical protein
MGSQVKQEAADGVPGGDEHTLTGARHFDSHTGRGPKRIQHPGSGEFERGKKGPGGTIRRGRQETSERTGRFH